MEAKAYLRNVRISPRKVSVVLNLIRNKDTETAMAILKYTPKAACEPLQKLLKSAIANADHNYGMDTHNLYVAECFVCPGPTMKRIRPRAPGPRVQGAEAVFAHHPGFERTGMRR